MILKSLELTNFKGIKHFVFKPDGKNMNVYGDNGTGKTTLYDAFLWLLFDKDSQNRSTFAIKTLDKDGETVHGLDHEVLAVLGLSDKELTLKKSYKEKWTKKRGSATEEFTGHTTDYFINDVPVKKSEYDAKIAEIANENVFKLLTNPSYFNEQLGWQDRRANLLAIAGDIADAEIIKTSKELAELPAILQGRSIDDHKKVIQAKRSEIIKELEKIPVRIDEIKRGLPEIDDSVDWAALPAVIEATNNLISRKLKEIATLESGGGIAEKTKQLNEIEAKIIKEESARLHEKEEIIRQNQAKHAEIRANIRDCEDKMERAENAKECREEEVNELEAKMDKLRNEWTSINNQEADVVDTCPTCEQQLPEHKIEEAIAKFNQAKAEKLEEITTAGKQLKARADNIKTTITKKDEDIKTLNESLTELQPKLDASQKEIEQLKSREIALDKSLFDERKQLENEITELEDNSKDAIEKAETECKKHKETLANLEQVQQNIKTRNEAEARIVELKAREKVLAKDYEQLERELNIVEQFTRAKVSLLENKINSMFKLAKFKLFETQVNGGINEVCETIYNGVPYSQGLNNAARINVGLDIISTFSKWYGFTVPIFVDNAEAVTELIPVGAQVIRLVVSSKDKQLRIEEAK